MIKRRNLVLVMSIVVVVLVGCGTEIRRIPFDSVSAGETEVQVDTAKNIEFWTDLEIKFYAEIDMDYLIELYQDGELIREATCSVFDVFTKVKPVMTVDMEDLFSFKYAGEMTCSVSVANSGQTLVNKMKCYGCSASVPNSGQTLVKAERN